MAWPLAWPGFWQGLVGERQPLLVVGRLEQPVACRSTLPRDCWARFVGDLPCSGRQPADLRWLDAPERRRVVATVDLPDLWDVSQLQRSAHGGGERPCSDFPALFWAGREHNAAGSGAIGGGCHNQGSQPECTRRGCTTPSFPATGKVFSWNIQNLFRCCSPWAWFWAWHDCWENSPERSISPQSSASCLQGSCWARLFWGPLRPGCWQRFFRRPRVLSLRCKGSPSWRSRCFC